MKPVVVESEADAFRDRERAISGFSARSDSRQMAHNQPEMKERERDGSAAGSARPAADGQGAKRRAHATRCKKKDRAARDGRTAWFATPGTGGAPVIYIVSLICRALANARLS